MNLFSAIVAIVAIWGVVQVAGYWTQSRRDTNTGKADSEQREAISALEERVRTLERIVTDDRESLVRKFDDL